MTLMADCKAGKIPEIVKLVAESEGVSPEFVRGQVASGRVVIPRNKNRSFDPIGIGQGLSTKVNANLGTSRDKADIEFELAKLKAALEAKTDAVMDLSTGGDLSAIRKVILDACPVPLGTVPIYETAIRMVENQLPMVNMNSESIFSTIEDQARMGVDFITVHCGVTRNLVRMLLEGDRLMEVVSRGGSFLIEWVHYNQAENPLYEHYDRLLELAREYELTLSLGDGLRPGTIIDATDKPQIQELVTLGELVERARKADVQSMVEGPGHIPVNQIETNVRLEKSLCKDAPFYVLGPIVTDIAPGYDHITSAIGGALAGSFGADFLCYVTRAEHLCLPDRESVWEGVMAARIAAHAADLAKGFNKAWEWDRQMSKARKKLDWEKMLSLAIDPELARKTRATIPPEKEEVCTMCGEFCALKKIGEIKA
ncbi:phosphomethylpyrimidine synthase ThiC [bacterium]|nr:phosphomethylpyrimidine synthase ThiC [bacterium]